MSVDGVADALESQEGVGVEAEDLEARHERLNNVAVDEAHRGGVGVNPIQRRLAWKVKSSVCRVEDDLYRV